jgi:hypothetical protein
MFRLHFHCHPSPQIHRGQNHYNNSFGSPKNGSHVFEQIFSLFTTRAREPNFCEPSLHIFLVNFELWFTFFLSSQIYSEPVNHVSQITQAPIFFHAHMAAGVHQTNKCITL